MAKTDQRRSDYVKVNAPPTFSVGLQSKPSNEVQNNFNAHAEGSNKYSAHFDRAETTKTSVSDEFAKKPTHFDAFQAQLDIYKTQLIGDLNSDLNNTDVSLVNDMNSLTEKFDVRCNIIANSGQAIGGTLDQERLEVGVEGQMRCIVFGHHMADFRDLYKQKSARLKELWSQYESIQKLIMELAVSICNDDEVLIGYAELQQEPGKEVGPGINEDRASEQREEFNEAYIGGVNELDELKVRVDALVNKTLEENTEIWQDLQTRYRETKQEVNKLLNQLEVN